MGSLQSVEHGRVIALDNKDLCYVDKLRWSSLVKNASQIIIKGNRNVTECGRSMDFLSFLYSYLFIYNLTYSRANVNCYTSNRSLIKIPRNQNPLWISDAESEGKVCHSECRDSGCFGPLDSQCFECRSHKQGESCLPSCGMGWFAENKTGDGPIGCLKCHEQCKGSCFGEVSFWWFLKSLILFIYL